MKTPLAIARLVTDVDECALGIDKCSTNAQCINTVGSYTCECNEGWAGDGLECQDIDECSQAEPVCDEAAACTNTLGSYICTCKPPKVGDGKTCVGMSRGIGYQPFYFTRPGLATRRPVYFTRPS